MSYRELFVSPSVVFGGFQRSFDEADYVILGVPLDATSTFRAGCRFAPSAIRQASLNLETYSFRAGIDAEDLMVHDLGDFHVTGKVDENLSQLELVVKEILEARKLPVLLGGEHTITLGATRGISENIAVVSLDAHLDMRNEYLGLTTSHTTFMRRIYEQVKPKKILEIGTRAACKEELDFAKNQRIQFLTVQQIMEDGLKKAIQKIGNILSNLNKIYLTIDMDVLDPAFAPAVQNPEPDGLDMHTLLDLLYEVCKRSIVAFDLVEVTPHYDAGTTAIQAAKIILEVLCYIEK
jgi:agmatinase